MNVMRTKHPLTAVALLLVPACLAPRWCESAESVRRNYSVRAELVSYLPGEGIESFQDHGSGMSVGGGILGLGLSVNDLSFVVESRLRPKDGKLFVVVDLDSQKAKQDLGFQTRTLDLSDLKPTSVRVAESDQRLYQLNLFPGVQTVDRTPRNFDVGKLKLHNWRFPNSPVLVDDAIYVGRLGFAQSPIAFIDISDVARVEFSLHKLSDSEPWGVLDQGVITLENPETDTQIQISNVKNGDLAVELPDGPYRVWVRWSSPTHTAEEHWEQLVKTRERIERGEIPNASTTYIDKQLARAPGPWIFTSGIRGLLPDDRP